MQYIFFLLQFFLVMLVRYKCVWSEKTKSMFHLNLIVKVYINNEFIHSKKQKQRKQGKSIQLGQVTPNLKWK